jgi:hypothetical protein
MEGKDIFGKPNLYVYYYIIIILFSLIVAYIILKTVKEIKDSYQKKII